MDLFKRLTKVVNDLTKAAEDERGFSGALRHTAEIDNWTLSINQSDFGDIMLVARSSQDEILGYEGEGPSGEWVPFVVNTPELQEWFVSLFERGEWKDRIPRRKP